MYKKFLICFIALSFPFLAFSATETEINEKHIKVAMRMIGHEMLTCLGDVESRILPIEKVAGRYKIPFEKEFGFDPDDIVSIIDRVMKKTQISTDYFVEVEECNSGKVVHAYEINSEGYDDMIPCAGRLLPIGCYSLMITLLDDANIPRIGTTDTTSFLASKTWTATLLKAAMLFIPLLLMAGYIVFFNRKKSEVIANPDLVLIGASEFDKKKMALSFENKSVELSNKETALLSLLHASANAPVERAVLLHKVWGDEGDYVGRTLDVFISKLRKKLEADTSLKIVNIRGVGYKLVVD